MPTSIPVFEKLFIPLEDAAATIFLDFWEGVFAKSFVDLRLVLSGEEQTYNTDTLYIARCGDELAGTCRLTICHANPAVGALGEVATEERFRGAGIGRRLCQRARDEFFGAGGKVIFLATSNPLAAGLYERLGWRFLPNTQIMANVADDAPLNAILWGQFISENWTIRAADPGARAPMVPLLAADHPWQILDINAGMPSTRFYVQSACEGLYPAYQALRKDGGGEWFVAEAAAGHPVGLASARTLEGEAPGVYRVDGFTHAHYSSVWPKLIRAAIDWSRAHDAARIEAHVVPRDDDKRNAFLRAGFVNCGPAPVEVQGQPRSAIRLVLGQ